MAKRARVQKTADDTTSFLGGRVVLRRGDSRDVLKTIPDNSIDSVVTDPPYALVSIVKRFGKPGSTPAKDGDVYARSSAGFMGQSWDTGETAFAAEFWAEVLRVLKPGGYVLAFSGTRTQHRMVCAIEDAGFEIRDQIGWAFGSGFPKSHDVEKSLIRVDREDVAADWSGWGSALKPAWEPICVARKPLIGTIAENVLTHGVGAINIDGCRVDAHARPLRELDAKATDSSVYVGRSGQGGLGKGLDGGSKAVGTTDVGRFPANLIHDGSDEVVTAFPDSAGQQGDVRGTEQSRTGGVGTNCYGEYGRIASAARNDSGSAARFFYTAKADADDRLGSKHPTVKPLDLMQYLVRLVTPKGGTVLDPFAGTGTTGEAAWREGMNAILIEREAEYQADIARRLELANNPTKRAAVAATKNSLDDPETLPLFAPKVTA